VKEGFVKRRVCEDELISPYSTVEFVAQGRMTFVISFGVAEDGMGH
jgi:hypothetical protein